MSHFEARPILTDKGIVPPVGDVGSFDASGFTVTWAYRDGALDVNLDGAWLFIGMAWKTVEGGIAQARLT